MRTFRKWFTAALIVGTSMAFSPHASAADALARPAVQAGHNACAVNVDTGEAACAATAGAARDMVVSASSSLLLARFWEHSNYAGAYMSMYGSQECTATTSDKDYTRGDLTATGWNDRISSLRTYNRCDARLYEHVHGGGQYTSWIDASSYLGSFNDRASSIRLS